MGIIEELKFEAAKRAGSPEGFLNLIRLIIREVEKIDVTSPRQYASLIRTYVLVKRQLAFFTERCENIEIDRSVYEDTLHQLKHAIKIKRNEAREYAARSIPPEKRKEINQYVGTHLWITPSEITSTPGTPRDYISLTYPKLFPKY